MRGCRKWSAAVRVTLLRFSPVASRWSRFVELCLAGGRGGSPFGTVRPRGAAAGFLPRRIARRRRRGMIGSTRTMSARLGVRPGLDSEKTLASRQSNWICTLVDECWAPRRAPRTLGRRRVALRPQTPPRRPTQLASVHCAALRRRDHLGAMDHLLLGTAANKVHDRSLQASATQKWAASTTTEALADVFDDDDALSELRQTPAVTQDAASLASKASDATAARFAHTLDRISPDTAHTAAVPAQTTPRKTDVREDPAGRVALGGDVALPRCRRRASNLPAVAGDLQTRRAARRRRTEGAALAPPLRRSRGFSHKTRQAPADALRVETAGQAAPGPGEVAGALCGL